MRKMSKAAKVEAYDTVVGERDVWQTVAWHFANDDKPDATEIVKDRDGDRYVFRLYGAMRASGGILVRIFQCAGQANQIEAMRFDDWIRVVEKMPYAVGCSTDVRIAADRLRVARQRLYDAELAASRV